MFAIIENGIIKATGSVASLFPNTSFPPGGASLEFLQQHNVHEIVDGLRMDERFYWVTQSGLEVIDGAPTRVYVNTPKQLEDVTETPEGETEPIITRGLKSQWIAQAKQNCNATLSATDWMVIRKAERGVDIPEEVAQERADILAKCDELEAAITAAQTIEEFIAAVMR